MGYPSCVAIDYRPRPSRRVRCEWLPREDFDKASRPSRAHSEDFWRLAWLWLIPAAIIAGSISCERLVFSRFAQFSQQQQAAKVGTFCSRRRNLFDCVVRACRRRLAFFI